MKNIAGILLVLTGFVAASSAQLHSLRDRVGSADVIAVVSVTNVIKSVSTSGGTQAIAFVAEASVERLLKGPQQKSIRVRDEAADTVLSATDLYHPVGVPPKAHARIAGTRRFFVLLKASPEGYLPLARDCIAGVYGSDSASARVAWVWGCPTLDEAVLMIEALLEK